MCHAVLAGSGFLMILDISGPFHWIWQLSGDVCCVYLDSLLCKVQSLHTRSSVRKLLLTAKDLLCCQLQWQEQTRWVVLACVVYWTYCWHVSSSLHHQRVQSPFCSKKCCSNPKVLFSMRQTDGQSTAKNHQTNYETIKSNAVNSSA